MLGSEYFVLHDKQTSKTETVLNVFAARYKCMDLYLHAHLHNPPWHEILKGRSNSLNSFCLQQFYFSTFISADSTPLLLLWIMMNSEL
jgi:hypothetical protein